MSFKRPDCEKKMNMRVCVSLGMATVLESLEEALMLGEKADVLEIRLDLMREPAVKPFLTKIKLPLLFTNRADWEGGRFSGHEEDRLDLLLKAMEDNASYVDLELRAPEQSWKKALTAGIHSTTRLVCSWHDFNRTPGKSQLEDTLLMMQDSGANIGKIVTMADDHRDALRVLNLQEKAAQLDFPLISFAMGEAGRISRAATCALGGYMTYCAPDSGEQTAPGQIRVSDLRTLYEHLYR
jgi:3-dehydroquinate dehydratase-1/3-dehydroquinate dehydratase/shikimate dehydrogenase